MRAGAPRQSREPYPPNHRECPARVSRCRRGARPCCRPRRWPQIASRVTLTGVDIDLTGAKWRSRFVRPELPETYESVTSLWIPATATDCDVSRPGSAATALTDRDRRRTGKDPNGKRQLATAIRSRHLTPSSTRVALAIRPRNPDGNRAHLGQIALACVTSPRNGISISRSISAVTSTGCGKPRR